MTYQDFTPGTKVKITGVPAKVTDFTGKEIDNPYFNAIGVVRNNQPGDIDVVIDGLTDELGTGFLPESLELCDMVATNTETLTKAYEASWATGELPKIKGVTYEVETLEAWLGRHDLTRESGFLVEAGRFSKTRTELPAGPQRVKAVIYGYPVEITKKDISGYRQARNWKFVINDNAVNSGKRSNYSTLAAAVKKALSEVPVYLTEKEAKAKAKRESELLTERLAKVVTAAFPEATASRYKERLYHIPFTGSYDGLTLKVAQEHTPGVGYSYGERFTFAGLPGKYTADQVRDLIAIMVEANAE